MPSRTSIADWPALHLSERSIRHRVRVICDRLGLRTPIEAVVRVAGRGLV